MAKIGGFLCGFQKAMFNNPPSFSVLLPPSKKLWCMKHLDFCCFNKQDTVLKCCRKQRAIRRTVSDWWTASRFVITAVVAGSSSNSHSVSPPVEETACTGGVCHRSAAYLSPHQLHCVVVLLRLTLHWIQREGFSTTCFPSMSQQPLGIPSLYIFLTCLAQIIPVLDFELVSVFLSYLCMIRRHLRLSSLLCGIYKWNRI